MTGDELKIVMKRIGIQCKTLAHLCGWQSDSRIVDARRRRNKDIPEIIDATIEKFIGSKRYQRIVDTILELSEKEIQNADADLSIPSDVDINSTHKRQLQIIAARYGVRIELSQAAAATSMASQEEDSLVDST